jgi:hypothetical protein
LSADFYDSPPDRLIRIILEKKLMEKGGAGEMLP